MISWCRSMRIPRRRIERGDARPHSPRPVMLQEIQIHGVKSRSSWPRLRTHDTAFKKTSGITTAEPALMKTPPPWRPATTAAEQPEIAMARSAERLRIGGRMRVRGVGADRHMDGDWHARAPGLHKRLAEARLGPAKRLELAAQRFARAAARHAAADIASFHWRPVSSAAPKRPSGVRLRRPRWCTRERDFKIVDRRRPFMAKDVAKPRCMRSIKTGARPHLITCPPMAQMTGLWAVRAAAIASTTARSESAARRRGRLASKPATPWPFS